mgnify:CR=1 FL=1|tara:strand:+ start:406 stop:738 length:333 start_codon:yes stop_codon:yes gene_type:complete
MANNEKEMKEMKEMEKEMERLKKITDQLWKEGKATKWKNMSHTNIGVEIFESEQHEKKISNFMTKLITNSTTKKSKTKLTSMTFIANNNQTGIRFGKQLHHKKVSYLPLY